MLGQGCVRRCDGVYIRLWRSSRFLLCSNRFAYSSFTLSSTPPSFESESLSSKRAFLGALVSAAVCETLGASVSLASGCDSLGALGFSALGLEAFGNLAILSGCIVVLLTITKTVDESSGFSQWGGIFTFFPRLFLLYLFLPWVNGRAVSG